MAHAIVAPTVHRRARSRSRPSSAVRRSRRLSTALRLWPSSAERMIGTSENSRSASSGFGVDHEPRLALRGQHVVAVQVLVDEHRLALARRQRLERVERGVEQPALERAPRGLPVAGQVGAPPGGLVRERPERRAGGDPQARQQVDQHGQRVAVGARQRLPRLAALEQQRPAVTREQPDRAVAVPALERVRLVLGLAMWVGMLEHGRRSVGQGGAHRTPAGTGRVRLTDAEFR